MVAGRDRCWSATPGTPGSAASACSAPSPIRSFSPARTQSASPTSRRVTAPIRTTMPPAPASGICRSPLAIRHAMHSGLSAGHPEAGPIRTPLLRSRSWTGGRTSPTSSAATLIRRSAVSSRRKPMTASAAASPPAAQWESNDRRAHADGAVPEFQERPTAGASTRSGVGSDLSEYNTFPVGCQQNGAGPGGGSLRSAA